MWICLVSALSDLTSYCCTLAKTTIHVAALLTGLRFQVLPHTTPHPTPNPSYDESLNERADINEYS